MKTGDFMALHCARCHAEPCPEHRRRSSKNLVLKLQRIPILLILSTKRSIPSNAGQTDRMHRAKAAREPIMRYEV
jgi:hypothetical protein